MNAAIQGIGLIGVGRMGIGLLRNLVRAGYAVHAFDPNPEALREAAALGATAAGSIAEAAAGADAIITCLPDVATVRATHLGPGGIVASATPGCLLLEMTSSDAILTREIGLAAAARGLGMVDAPMLRGAPQAWDGTVHVLLGGSTGDKARSWPVLAAVSERITDAGGLGDAHALKAVNNAVTMGNNAVLAEAMMAGGRLGFAPGLLVEVLASGLGSRMLDLYAPRFVGGEHTATASLGIAEKDLGIFLRGAGAAGAPTPVLAAAHRVYQAACDGGDADLPPSRLPELLAAGLPHCAAAPEPRTLLMRPLTLDPATTALVLIDLQHGIVAMPVAPRTGIEVVEAAARLASAMREAGGLVVLVRVTPSADGGDALSPSLDQPPPPPGDRPADWAELVPAIRGERDIVITKRQ